MEVLHPNPPERHGGPPQPGALSPLGGRRACRRRGARSVWRTPAAWSASWPELRAEVAMRG